MVAIESQVCSPSLAVECELFSVVLIYFCVSPHSDGSGTDLLATPQTVHAAWSLCVLAGVTPT